ncbi:histone H1.1, embryonic-like [Leguminivora glycinivorella]|uniref:histone H1.1, embryonic-like n=1 Tax=Leguminivora glycinivorella TaxID=1035111 RepID=UPI00200DF707|nr:histone H1.1, embryonic-like [Leguminivora glycinivorella]
MSDSDVEIKKIAPMKPVKKPPPSPTESLLKAHEKKVTTKAMIHEALTELKSRKGVSIQAIKKYMEDKYYVQTDKVKYLIKKTLKIGVEDGSIVQLKGIGASGSFKLAAVKEKPKKPKTKKEKPKKESTKEKSKEKPAKDKKEKVVKEKTKTDKMKPPKKVKMDVKDKEKKTEKPKDKKKAELKEKKTKTAGTAKKKASMMKRKSIGSIIKPPRMKPKSKA